MTSNSFVLNPQKSVATTGMVVKKGDPFQQAIILFLLNKSDSDFQLKRISSRSCGCSWTKTSTVTVAASVCGTVTDHIHVCMLHVCVCFLSGSRSVHQMMRLQQSQGRMCLCVFGKTCVIYIETLGRTKTVTKPTGHFTALTTCNNIWTNRAAKTTKK